MPKREMEVLTPQMYYVLLVLHQPMHGYEIMNKITEITHGEVTVGAGSLYTLLPKFEKECYIKLVKVENNKKIYQITNLGKKKLQKEKERSVENMAKIILASHGGLSKGMKDSVSMIVGDLAKDIETYSLLPGENPEDFYQEVLKEAKECEEQILILCDIKGGSVHTALSKLAVLDNVLVFSGMNMGLVLDAVMKGLNGKLELAEANDLIEAAKDGMTVMSGMTSEDDEDF